MPRVSYADLVAEELDLGPKTMVSVDVEDYYHEVPGGEDLFAEGRLPSNMATNVEMLLDMFARQDVTATFFVLGCTAERLRPQLQRMLAEGHEVASHGHMHLRATQIPRETFREDARRSKETLEDVTGREIRGFRAPFFAIVEQNLWVLDEIAELGFAYDSSVSPVTNFAYGVRDAPERPHRLVNGLVELPLPRASILGRQMVVGGGFYLRAYPFWLTQRMLHRRDPSLPRMFYIHPWEGDDRRLNLWDLDAGLAGLRWRPRLMKFITTYNRGVAIERFERLLELWRPGISIERALAA